MHECLPVVQAGMNATMRECAHQVSSIQYRASSIQYRASIQSTSLIHLPVQSDRVTTLSDRVNTLSGRVTTLSGSRENQSGRLATLSGSLTGLSGFEKNATGRVNILSGWPEPQSGSEYFQSGRGVNLLLINDYSRLTVGQVLFPENKKYRIRNKKFESFGKPQRGEISITPGFNPGSECATTPAPLFNAPVLNFLFPPNCRAGLISYSLLIVGQVLFQKNKEHRIRNNKSGSFGKPQRGEISIAPDVLSGQAPGFNPGIGSTHTRAPLFNAPVLNFLFPPNCRAGLISYSRLIVGQVLFQQNKEHRIRNTESGSLEKPQRGEISITPGFNPGIGSTHTRAPLFKAPALATEQWNNAPIAIKRRITPAEIQAGIGNQEVQNHPAACGMLRYFSVLFLPLWGTDCYRERGLSCPRRRTRNSQGAGSQGLPAALVTNRSSRRCRPACCPLYLP